MARLVDEHRSVVITKTIAMWDEYFSLKALFDMVQLKDFVMWRNIGTSMHATLICYDGMCDCGNCDDEANNNDDNVDYNDVSNDGDDDDNDVIDNDNDDDNDNNNNDDDDETNKKVQYTNTNIRCI